MRGIPVIVGGRAFGSDGQRARRLGADAWATTAEEAAAILQRWRLRGPPIPAPPVSLDPSALPLLEQAAEIAQTALAGLVATFPPMGQYSDEQSARTREDLAFNVQFLAAAMLVRDDTIFTDFLDWLQSLLASRGVPPSALPAGLEALKPAVHEVAPDGVRLLDLGSRALGRR